MAETGERAGEEASEAGSAGAEELEEGLETWVEEKKESYICLSHSSERRGRARAAEVGTDAVEEDEEARAEVGGAAEGLAARAAEG